MVQSLSFNNVLLPSRTMGDCWSSCKSADDELGFSEQATSDEPSWISEASILAVDANEVSVTKKPVEESASK